MNNTQRLQYLFQKQLDASATEAEQQELFMLSNDPQHEPLLFDLMNQTWDDLDNSRPQALPHTPVIWKLWFRVSVAAVVLVIAAGAWFWRNNKKSGTGPAPQQIAKVQDVAPGKEGAILTLPDGRQVVLDDLQNGSVLQENGAHLIVKNGQLS